MKKRRSRLMEFIRPQGRLKRVLRVGGLAMLLLPEPVTTPIGVTMLGLSLAVPSERRRPLVRHCGASIRRGSLGSFGPGHCG